MNSARSAPPAPQLAVAADTELHRRHPGQPWPPLRSVEPEPSTDVQHKSPALTPEDDLEQTAQRIRDLAARYREFADKLAQRQSLVIPAEDPGYEQFGRAFPDWEEHRTDAILQPPRPQIVPCGQVLERIVGRDLDMERLTDHRRELGRWLLWLRTMAIWVKRWRE